MFGRSAQISFTDRLPMLVRAEDPKHLPRERQHPSPHSHIRPGNYLIDGTTSICDDGESESHTSKMRVLSKANLAAKRAAVKGVPKSTCDLPLGEVAARKPIFFQDQGDSFSRKT